MTISAMLHCANHCANF